MIVWPDKLVVDIARRACVLYIGAGVSANSANLAGVKPPMWSDFLCMASGLLHDGDVRSYVNTLIEQGEMLDACDVVIDNIGFGAFCEFATDKFRRPGFRHAEMHEVVYSLDSRVVITPNVDQIYDQYVMATSHGTVVIKKYDEEDLSTFLRSQDRIVLKAHGSIDAPRKMVFSRKQYNEVRYKHATFYKILDSLALTHTYVFLGCGLTDPDIRLTLENNNFLFPGCRPHYFVCSGSTTNASLRKILKDNRNLEVLQYANADGTHSELLESLRQLAALVENARTSLAESQNW